MSDEDVCAEHFRRLRALEDRVGGIAVTLAEHGHHIDALRRAEQSLATEIGRLGHRLEELHKMALEAKVAAEEARHAVSQTGQAMIRANAMAESRIRDHLTTVSAETAQRLDAQDRELERQTAALEAIRTSSAESVEVERARAEREASRHDADRNRAQLRLIALVGAIGLVAFLASLRLAGLQLDDKYIFGLPAALGALAVYLINSSYGRQPQRRGGESVPPPAAPQEPPPPRARFTSRHDGEDH